MRKDAASCGKIADSGNRFTGSVAEHRMAKFCNPLRQWNVLLASGKRKVLTFGDELGVAGNFKMAPRLLGFRGPHPNVPLAVAVLFQIPDKFAEPVPNGILLLQTAGNFIH